MICGRAAACFTQNLSDRNPEPCGEGNLSARLFQSFSPLFKQAKQAHLYKNAPDTLKNEIEDNVYT